MPPSKPDLDWLSLRFDIFGEEKDAAKGERILKFAQKYAQHEPALLKELERFQHRLPDFADQAVMLSPAGFFDDTPENAVVLFDHIYADAGFDIKSLEAVPDGLSAEVVGQYYERPRTVLEYCTQVWRKHVAAKQTVVQRKEEKANQEVAILNARLNGLPAPERQVFLSGPALYKQLMQGFAFAPKKSSTFNLFYGECKSLLKKRPVMLRLPRVFKEDYYDKFTERFTSAVQETVRLPKDTSMYLKDVIRLLVENAKVTTRKAMREAAFRVLRRHLATHISGQFPMCYEALAGLPVTITVFEEIKVSFELKFSERYHSRRTLYVSDFAEVIRSIGWLEDGLKTLGALAAALP